MEFMARCDRCGALVEASSRKRGDGMITYYTPCAVVTEVSSNDVPVRDGCEYTVLCPDCVGQLKEWLAEAPKDKKGQVDESAGEDSVERLIDDMARVAAAMADEGDSVACSYFGRNVMPCTEFDGTACPAYCLIGKTCAEFALEDFRRRCKALGIGMKDGEQ